MVNVAERLNGWNEPLFMEVCICLILTKWSRRENQHKTLLCNFHSLIDSAEKVFLQKLGKIFSLTDAV